VAHVPDDAGAVLHRIGNTVVHNPLVLVIVDHELVCSAQNTVDPDGNPVHAGDFAAQLGHALDNLETVLAGADMGVADIVRLNLYATDLDALFQNFTQVTQRFDGNRFDTTVLGVSALASPDVQVALEAIAMD
jgi:enamine deaminase RidA (YjgF/YER057c/UK114 family)